jgi:hypothetical protein
MHLVPVSHSFNTCDECNNEVTVMNIQLTTDVTIVVPLVVEFAV